MKMSISRENIGEKNFNMILFNSSNVSQYQTDFQVTQNVKWLFL